MESITYPKGGVRARPLFKRGCNVALVTRQQESASKNGLGENILMICNGIEDKPSTAFIPTISTRAAPRHHCMSFPKFLHSFSPMTIG
jgi:hypothetical protein